MLSIVCLKLKGQRKFKSISQLMSFLQKDCKMLLMCKNLGPDLLFARILQYIYILKYLARFLSLTRNLQVVSPLDEYCKISIFCKIRSRYLLFLKSSRMSLIPKNLGGILLFAKILQGIWKLQEFYIISVFCMKPAGYLFFARIMRDKYFLQKSRSISHIFKNLQDLAFSEKWWRISLVCKNLARYLKLARVLHDFNCSHETCRISPNCKISASHFFRKSHATYLVFENSCKLWPTRRNHGGCVLFSRIMQDIFYLSEACKITAFGKEPQSV